MTANPIARRQPPLPTIVRGHGRPLVFLHGFGMAPTTYHRMVGLLSQEARVLLPMWLYVEGEWQYGKALDGLHAMFEQGISEPAVLVGHSAGGAVALGFAARWPERLSSLVLVNSLGASDRQRMRRSAVPGRHLGRLASLAATRDFFGTIFTRPRDLGRAAMWAYRHEPTPDIIAVRDLDLSKHVLWAERDALLPVEDGRRFAERLHARFTIVPGGDRPIDHDWPVRRPRRFLGTLQRLGILEDRVDA